jgi:hypothetical protein
VKSNPAVLGAVALILITAIALSANAIAYGQSSNALILLLGFAGTQIPVLLKMQTVEKKVDGNYSVMMEHVKALQDWRAETLSVLPPEVAGHLPPVATTGTEET